MSIRCIHCLKGKDQHLTMSLCPDNSGRKMEGCAGYIFLSTKEREFSNLVNKAVETMGVDRIREVLAVSPGTIDRGQQGKVPPNKIVYSDTIKILNKLLAGDEDEI